MIRNVETLKEGKSKDEELLIFDFSPTLKIGANQLSFLYKNVFETYDTLNVDVTVSGELSIKELYNYPNPMSNRTSFIFNLAGSNQPSFCKIKIYTVTGRLIKLLDIPVTIGYNRFLWDGRDEDGDYVANGVYLYKLVIDDKIRKETSIQKLVVLR